MTPAEGAVGEDPLILTASGSDDDVLVESTVVAVVVVVVVDAVGVVVVVVVSDMDGGDCLLPRGCFGLVLLFLFFSSLKS